MNKWTVWVGGGEVNDYYLDLSQAISIAQEWQENGYSDVVIENVQ